MTIFMTESHEMSKKLKGVRIYSFRIWVIQAGQGYQKMNPEIQRTQNWSGEHVVKLFVLVEKPCFLLSTIVVQVKKREPRNQRRQLQTMSVVVVVAAAFGCSRLASCFVNPRGSSSFGLLFRKIVDTHDYFMIH